MGRKKMLAILGSPHKNGTTAAMLKCAADAAENSGWEVRQVWLYGRNIAYCNGCCACVKTASCAIQDDLQEIAKLIKECDAVALAAPVYWANVPAAVKNMFDRLYGTAMDSGGLIPKPRLSSKQRYLLLTACHTPSPFSWMFGQSSGALRAMDEFFKYAGMKRIGKAVFAGARGKHGIPPALERRIKGYVKALNKNKSQIK